MSTARITLGNSATIIPESVTLSHGEGDAFWAASIRLTTAADYAALSMHAAVTLTWRATTWALVVHARDRSADGIGGWRYGIEAVSPVVALSDRSSARVDIAYATPIPASTAVASLIGSIDWQMIDWPIPANRLVAQRAVPLELARRIIEAAGGVLESQPDGSLLARPAFPVAVPDIAAAQVDLSLMDVDSITAISDTLTLERIVNRLRIANDGGSGTGLNSVRDRIEITVRDDGLTADVIVIPDPWRPVTAAINAGNASLTPLVEKTVAAAGETVEFIRGQGNIQHPANSVPTLVWSSEAPTSPAVLSDDQAILTVNDPLFYGLADVSYDYRQLTCLLAAAIDTTVQIVVADANGVTTSSTVTLSAKSLSGSDQITISRINEPRLSPHIAIAPAPDLIAVSEGSLQFIRSESIQTEEIIQFNGSASAILQQPDPFNIEILSTYRFFLSDFSDASGVTFIYDSDRRAIIASEPVYAALRVRYQAQRQRYQYTFANVVDPITHGVAVFGGMIIALKGTSVASLFVDPPTLADDERQETELYRVVSKMVVDQDNKYEFPVGFPNKNWKDFGFGDFPDKNNFLVVDRTHEIGRLHLNGYVQTVRESVDHEQPTSKWPPAWSVRWAPKDSAFIDAYGRVDFDQIRADLTARYPGITL